MSSNEYMRVYMMKRYHRLRGEALIEFGNACVDCGSSESLEFDHVDPETKEFEIGRAWSMSRERRERELAKCVLRCASCHGRKTNAPREVGHGGGASGKRNCPCAPCKARKREYNQNYKLRRSGNSAAE